MAVLPVGFGASGGYTIDRSLRFRSSASAYLSRTPASAGNRKTWTWSAWVKRGSVNSTGYMFGARTAAGGTYFIISITSAHDLRIESNSETSYPLYKTNALLRDPSAWYHFVVALDMTQATSTNRLKVYVNGVLQTTASYNVPAQNTDLAINSTETHLIGQQASAGYFDGYQTEVNFIDGQALDPTYFGEYNSDTGVWQPKKYGGAYGTNGFYLNFSDNSTTTTLGYDTSGQGNNWTSNNISVTSGVTYDSMTDVPTLTSEDAANFATLNPLDKYSSTIGTSEANLKLISTSGGAYQQIRNTFGMSSGKWYMEWVLVSQGTAGRTGASLVKSNSPLSGAAGSDLYSWVYHATGSAYFNNTTIALSTGALALGDLVMYAFDVDTGSFWMGKNGTWANSGNPTTGANPLYTGLTADAFFFGGWAYNTSDVVAMNFGQRPFAYTPPTGFKSLNTYNLTDSTIVDGSQYFDVLLETGTGSARNVTGLQFAPDFLWAKGRNASSSHLLYDTVRGVDKSLNTNNALDEDTTAGQLTSFNSNGYSLPNDTAGYLNLSGRTYAFWNWKANGSGVTNNEGTIESTVSANTTAGFSIVTYTGNGTPGATVGHGVGVAPSMIILKSRTVATNWYVYHSRLTSDQYQLYLNLTSGEDATGITAFNDKAPTSSVFELPGSGYGSNNSGATYVAYCFAEVEGFSKFGSYTGNGSPDGPFSYLGFRPAFVMIKSTGVGTRWIIWDAARDTYNVADKTLAPNFNAEEFVNPPYWYVDLLSNGFKVRGYQSGDTENNYPSSTYIYMAFAENPFKNALAR